MSEARSTVTGVIFDGFDDDGYPVDGDGKRLSPADARWRVVAAERRDFMDEMFETDPAMRSTLVLFSQGDLWVDREANVRVVKNIDPTYAANILRFLERRATMLWWRYNVASALLDGVWRAENEIEDTPVYDDEMYARRMTGEEMPMRDFGFESEEDYRRRLNEWSWMKLARTPLVEALTARATSDRWDEVDAFLADA